MLQLMRSNMRSTGAPRLPSTPPAALHILTCPGRKLPPLLRSVSTPLSPLSPCRSTNTLPVQPQPGRDEVYTMTCSAVEARQGGSCYLIAAVSVSIYNT